MTPLDSRPRLWFTSDTHFLHDNVIEYCNRPFQDADHMNQELVRLWNETVSPEDYVYHLGDVAFKRKREAEKIDKLLLRLNGNKFLIPGNHDYPNPQQYEGHFTVLGAYVEMTLEGYTLQLGHVPPDTMDSMGKVRDLVPGADYYLCGHVHTAWTRRGNVINVGTDAWGYTPVSLEQLLLAEQSPVIRGKYDPPEKG